MSSVPPASLRCWRCWCSSRWRCTPWRRARRALQGAVSGAGGVGGGLDRPAGAVPALCQGVTAGALCRSAPTAVHAVADVHDTPNSMVSPTFGVLWIVQVVPFQRSARVAWSSAGGVRPDGGTRRGRRARNAGEGWHGPPRVGGGLDRPASCRPSARPASPACRRCWWRPDGAASRRGRARNPVRTLSVAPVGLGVLCIVQVTPSQRSASAACVAALLTYRPMAVHAVADAQDTPNRVGWVPDGLGVLWMVQVVPSQRSASVMCALHCRRMTRRRCTPWPTCMTPRSGRCLSRRWAWGWSVSPTSCRPSARPARQRWAGAGAVGVAPDAGARRGRHARHTRQGAGRRAGRVRGVLDPPGAVEGACSGVNVA